MNRSSLLVVMVMIPATSLAGQTAPPSTPPQPAATVWSVRNWTRAEAWRFFEPPAGGGDNEYGYAANLGGRGWDADVAG